MGQEESAQAGQDTHGERCGCIPCQVEHIARAHWRGVYPDASLVMTERTDLGDGLWHVAHDRYYSVAEPFRCACDVDARTRPFQVVNQVSEAGDGFLALLIQDGT